MCGIQAFVGKKNKQVDLIKFKKLMLWNALGRGQEATGIFSPKNGLVKDNDRCDVFLGKNEIKSDTLLIGHVRASTYGGNTKDNAHPFNEGNITLVHNGTLTNPWPWARHHGIDITKVNVDSHVICHVLNKTQDFNVLGEINGAAALVMHDSNIPNRLYVYRNKDRELFHGKTSYGMYVSSIKASLESIGCVDIAEFPVGTLHIIENGEIKSTKEIESKPYQTPAYTNSTTSTTNPNQHTPTSLIGRWLYCDSSAAVNCDEGTNITYGNFYKCVGVTNEIVADNYMVSPRNYIYIIDNDNVRRKVDYWYFDNYCSRLDDGDYVFITNDLFYSEKVDGKEEKKLVLKKDQIVLVINSIEKDGKFSIHDGENEWQVPKNSIRKLTYNDEWVDNNHVIIANLELNYTKNKDKKPETKTNNKEEDKDEDDNTDNYFHVDAEILIQNDFSYLKEQLDEIISNYYSVPSVKILDNVRELLAHVENCIDEYTEIALEQGVVLYEVDMKENSKQEKILD